MSYKRSRATFEADLGAPYAIFGTPLPDEGERDDGAYLPLWKQDVRDEKGRRRLHGAFTGGWSAGYFNTVGSKEGWTPSTFVSSRRNRQKNEPDYRQQRAEDFMDEEDLADASEAQALKTSHAFAGLGFSTQEGSRAGGLMGILRTEGDTMGLKLLRRMGWKDGQGIGPKVRRAARLDLDNRGSSAAGAETYLFAPENAEMVQFTRKTDRRGLGQNGEMRLSSLRHRARHDEEEAEEEEDDAGLRPNQGPRSSLFSSERSKTKRKEGGFGVGVLNDTGSDEEDPYEMGPKIKYNRVMGGDKKKKPKKTSAAANPALKIAPVFTLKKVAKGGNSLRRCHDGRLPLDGFVLAQMTEDFSELLSRYAPPPVPQGWKSSKSSAEQGAKTEFVSTADAAKASNHDSRSRAALLGEKALPGKSVFDFISASEREKIMAASGKKDLPPARGEVPDEFRVSEEDHQKSLWDQVPRLDRDTAIAAIARGSRGPYADDEAKRSRYIRYLEHYTGSGRPLPEKRKGMSDEDFLREMNEFYNCARIFKPMTGFMASRFTTAKTPATNNNNNNTSSGASSNESEVLTRPESKPADPAEEAAKMGIFGNLTRSVEDFYPTRLLCKRFNVKAPAHTRTDDDVEKSEAKSSFSTGIRVPTGRGEDILSQRSSSTTSRAGGTEVLQDVVMAQPQKSEISGDADDGRIDSDRNRAIEGEAASADLLRAVFGDSDSDGE